MIIGNDISPVGNLSLDLLRNSANAATPAENQENAFDQALAAALSVFNTTNEDQKVADDTQIDFATGKSNDILRVIMAEQKAASSLELTVQLTSKVIEAYREIMRIQL